MSVVVGLALALLAVAAPASHVVGIRASEGLYIQEYWHDGVPRYAVYNAGVDTLSLAVRSLSRGKRRSIRRGDELMLTPGGTVPGDTLAIWQLPAGAVTLLPAVGIPDAPVREVRLLGLYGPYGQGFGSWSDAGIRWPVPESGVATYASLNVPGARQREAWVVQDRLWYESGEGFELDLVLAGGSGILQLSRVARWTSIPSVVVLDAECATLDVSDLGEVFEIDALNVDKDSGLHHVSVHCAAPEVTRPAMACLGGTLKVDPGWREEGFYRGILVRPRE